MRRRRANRCGGNFDLARRHRDFDIRLYEKVMAQDRRLVDNCATPESRRLHQMQRSVMRCLQAKKGFLRLRKGAGKILYAKTELEHDVLDLLIRHFHRRFPTYHISIQCGGKTLWVEPGGEIVEESAPVEEVVRRLEDGGLQKEDDAIRGGDLWRTFYDSQRIGQRENLALQQRMMPIKHRDADAWETNAALSCRNILEFT